MVITGFDCPPYSLIKLLHPRRKGKMKPKISIGACRRAIWIAGGGIPLMIRGEQVLITRDLRTQGQRWVSGDIRLPRAS